MPARRLSTDGELNGFLAHHLGVKNRGDEQDDDHHGEAERGGEEDVAQEESDDEDVAGEQTNLSADALDSIQRHMQIFAPSGIVDLSERGLPVLTPHVLDLTALGAAARRVEELDLSYNSMVRMSRRLLHPLTSLRELDLSHNSISELPEGVLLACLRTLNLSHNAMVELGCSADLLALRLPRLETLNLSHNRLKLVPPALSGCRALRDVDLSANNISATDDAALLRGSATTLERLSLADNRLLAAPAGLWDLGSLRQLELQGNRLSALPGDVARLTELRELSLERNHVAALPRELGQCRALELLALAPNPIAWPPEDVLGRPLPRLLEWLRQQRASDVPSTAPTTAPLAPPPRSAADMEREAREAEAAALRACLVRRQVQMDRRANEAAEALRRAHLAADGFGAAEAALDAQRARVGACLDQAEHAVAAASKAVSSISKEALDELRQLPSPPRAVQATMQAVHGLLGRAEGGGGGAEGGAAATPRAPAAPASPRASPTKPATTRRSSAGATAASPATIDRRSSGAERRGSAAAVRGGGGGGSGGGWEALRGVLQKNFTARVQRFCADQLSAHDVEAVRGMMPTESRAAVHKASKACGPLYDWAGAQLQHAAALQQAQPLRAELEQLEAQARALHDDQRAADAALRAAQQLVAALEVERMALQPELELAMEEAREFVLFGVPSS